MTYARPVRQRSDLGMNKTETAYSELLELRRLSGEIVDYRFEGLKLRLADGAWYKPDFFVVFPGHIELHEVKGFWREAARVRVKVAAELYPAFKFIAIKRRPKKLGGGWDQEEF